MLENFNIEEPLYPISVAAKLLNISVHTLRMYEREGLIIPFKKESNQRLYSKADLERIECIRKAINESKISINGIKTIYSLIPCWEIVKCSEEERESCEAFNQHSEPCWNVKHHKTVCDNNKCRECEVYKNFIQCGKVKELIKSISR
ncbi:MerR family transcriptional regulator [Stygiobacter electus]|uniref:MerR family transcriptional regulator n=1 Tax=Stygiobacter electus TaxID=3032292 RepID=A0AAE3P1T5_9BACT|nr:MerR family transcriptional regulator [Stygiobacter electus]MDF1612680.1 MerR family transcriptional regulator [Stygiobacter electus]